jgi:endonuclease/exonuclease/phosphatase family metal-dependent hydrolase
MPDPASDATANAEIHRGVPWWIWALCALPWAAWFLVRNHEGAVDVVAVSMPAIGGVTLVAAILLVRRGLRGGAAIAGSIAVLALVTTVLPRLPQPTAPPVDPVRLVSANVFQFSRWPGKAADTMTSRGADIVVSVEMGRSYWRHLAEANAYPYAARRGAQGVLSNWPLEPLPTLDGLPPDRIFPVQVDRPGGPFVIYVVHLLNPLHETTFSEQHDLVEQLLATVDAETLPTVIAGDLNLSDRTSAYRLLDGDRRDAMRAQVWPPWAAWPASTYVHGLWRALLLRIDHVFVPKDWCARDPGTFGVPGSDHRGLEVQIGRCAP